MSRLTREQIADIVDPKIYPLCRHADWSDYRPKKDMIGWKVVFITMFNSEIGSEYGPYQVPILAKIRITSFTNRTKYNNPLEERYAKHRCGLAKVIGYYSYYTGKEIKKLIAPPRSSEVPSFRYPSVLPGYVVPDYYDYGTSICSHGIHFFYEKQSALIWGDMMCCRNGLKLRNQAFVREDWEAY